MHFKACSPLDLNTDAFFLNFYFKKIMKPVTVLLLISSVCASLVPKVDFRFQKHIVFSSVGGGSSHNVWMLEVLKELHSRNHTVSFFSRVRTRLIE